jgi:hypothetical protein
MALFRRRYGDLVDRQLELFVTDHESELAALTGALDAHRTAERDDAEETYGDFQDQVDWLGDDLLAIRDGYMATLDVDAAGDYARAFNRAARRRLPHLAIVIDADEAAS